MQNNYELAEKFLRAHPNQWPLCHFYLHAEVDLQRDTPYTPSVNQVSLKGFIEYFEKVLAFVPPAIIDSEKKRKELEKLMELRFNQVQFPYTSDPKTQPEVKKKISIRKEWQGLINTLWGDFYRLFMLLVQTDDSYCVTPLDNFPSLETYCAPLPRYAQINPDKVCVLPALVTRKGKKQSEADTILHQGLFTTLEPHSNCWSYVQAFDQEAYLGEWHEIALVYSWFENEDEKEKPVMATYSVGTVSKALGFMNVDNQIGDDHVYGTASASSRSGVFSVRFLFPRGLSPPPPYSWAALILPQWNNYRIIRLGQKEKIDKNEPSKDPTDDAKKASDGLYSTSLVVSNKLVWILSRKSQMSRREYMEICDFARKRGVDLSQLRERPNAVV